MKLGIIIPTYDNLPMLKVLVKQIFKYTTGNFEVFVIEDGQLKKTVAWLETQKKLNVIYHKTNGGVAKSWNDGLIEAIQHKCDVFAILNDDIELVEGWWEECMSKFSTGAKILTLDGGENLLPCIGFVPITGWFFILTKSVVDRVGFFDETLGKYTAEDTDYAIRCKGIKYARLDLDIPHYGSKTLNKVAKADKNYKSNLEESFRRLRQKHQTVRMINYG